MSLLLALILDHMVYVGYIFQDIQSMYSTFHINKLTLFLLDLRICHGIGGITRRMKLSTILGPSDQLEHWFVMK